MKNQWKSRAAEALAGMKRPRMGRRLVSLLAAVAAMGFCVAVFDRIGLGTDPCSCMNLGFSRLLGIPFGTWQLLLNALLLLVVLRYDAGRIGAGTLANMVLVGYAAEFFMDVFDRFPALAALTLPVRMAVFVPTMALFLLAASIYMVVDLGVAPYDGVPQIIVAHARHMSFRAVRMCWDVGVMTVGFLLGSTVGLTTVVTGFCLGPAIAAVGNRVRGFYEEAPAAAGASAQEGMTP